MLKFKQQQHVWKNEILTLLQTKHNVQFNYAEDIIAGILLTSPSDNFSLEETLNYLQQNTALTFTLSNENLVLVSQKSALSLCGYLKNMDNHTPVVLASISGSKSSTVSNESGYFR